MSTKNRHVLFTLRHYSTLGLIWAILTSLLIFIGGHRIFLTSANDSCLPCGHEPIVGHSSCPPPGFDLGRKQFQLAEVLCGKRRS
jgi:hypothetical protein